VLRRRLADRPGGDRRRTEHPVRHQSRPLQGRRLRAQRLLLLRPSRDSRARLVPAAVPAVQAGVLLANRTAAVDGHLCQGVQRRRKDAQGVSRQQSLPQAAGHGLHHARLTLFPKVVQTIQRFLKSFCEIPKLGRYLKSDLCVL